jgi:subtilisin family serine protease
MNLRWLRLLLVVLAVPDAPVFAQAQVDPAVVDYAIVDGRRVTLTQVTNTPFYRIRGDARVAQLLSVRDRIEQTMGVVDVQQSGDQLAVRRNADGVDAARAAIGRLTRIQEADQLRVFTTDGGTTLLVEYPQIILQCDEGTTLQEVQEYLRRHYQVTVEPTHLRPGQFLVHVLTPNHTLWLANQLRTTKALPVRYADVNFWLAQPSGGSPPEFPERWPPALAGLPDDPGLAEQWALENRASKPGALSGSDIGFARAFRIAPLDASGVKIAVLDYAIDIGHQELFESIDAVFNATRYTPRGGMTDPALRQLEFVEQPEAQADHGTAAAGIIAAATSNHVGISGAAPGARIVAIQIAKPSVGGFTLVDGLTINAALRAAEEAQVHVVSLSWGLPLPAYEAYESVRAEIDSLNTARDNKGILVVSAAGNDQVQVFRPDFPADYSERAPNVLAAGASNWCGGAKTSGLCDREPWTSRFNAHTLFAPGVGILTVTNRRDTATPNGLRNYRSNFNGTSAATPFIAAAAALIFKQHPDWTAARVRQHLMSTADKLNGGDKAKLNICNALHGAARCTSPN